jgi:putative thioredoxin
MHLDPFRGASSPQDAHELQGDFGVEVLDESIRRPVVVDFWAEWCGPCRVLSPILEKLAAEAKGAWKLVKVNTDLNPELAQALRIRSLPTVMMIAGGMKTAEFLGALPEKQVRAWLQQNLPAAGAGEPAEPEDTLPADPGEARKQLEKTLEKHPEDQAARLALARLLFPRDPAKAAEAASRIPEDHELRSRAEDVRRLADILAAARKGHPEGAGDLFPLYRQAALDAAKGDYAKALDAWLEILGRDRNFQDDGARKAAVALFTVLGDDHPLTREYRRKLASAIY